MENVNTTIKAEGQPTELALQVIERLKRMRGNKAEIAIRYNCSRAMVSQYLNGKYQSNPEKIEGILRQFLADSEAEYGDGADGMTENRSGKATAPILPQKREAFESSDYMYVMSVCQSCQENKALGKKKKKSGFGKTYALKQYARLQRVAYLECDGTMSCKDLVEDIETRLGIGGVSSGTIRKRVNRIREFLNVNKGYLIIIDEADKLINKYTTAKMEIIRGIFDQSEVGIVIAGELRLEVEIKSYLDRFANRLDFYYRLHGLDTKELKRYMEGWDITEDAARELAERALEARNGCFRLLDRTLNNVIRILKGRQETRVTMDIVREASSLMMPR